MDRFKQRARELVSQMTIEEMCSQLKYDSAPVERLGIKGYNWWNEGLHGVARAGTATVFPQAIALAATFDTELLYQVGDVVSTEARAKYISAVEDDDRDIYKGLTLWSPNVNIFRDPRWGRGHETYGEDPYLTSELAVSYVNGIQGDGEYLKAAACAKHFAVHSGPETLRHEFDAQVNEKDLNETYLYAFEKLVKNGVAGVMGAYNRVNGEPACASDKLMNKLYNDWNFSGYFVSDCWALQDFHMHHGITKTAVDSAAMALKAGCHINCGCTYLHVMAAYEQGLVTKNDISIAAEKSLEIRLRLGMIDDADIYHISYDLIDCSSHNNISLAAAEKSMVLLENNGLLPLDKNKISSIAVIGPNADSKEALYGNYCGTSSCAVTFLQGIRERFSGKIYYSQGCHLYKDRVEGLALPADRISEAVAASSHADVTILCLGLDATLEGEEGDTGNAYASGDKTDLFLPEPQRLLLKRVLDVGKPVIVVLASGSALNIADARPAALIQAWYPGSHGGTALSEILFGEISPSGKLPITFYRSSDDLPDICDYSMRERTYRYFSGDVLYPFGYGLTYSHMMVKNAVYGNGKIVCEVANTGDCDTEDVIQVYCDTQNEFSPRNPKLIGFRRIYLRAGATEKFDVELCEDAFTDVDSEGIRGIHSKQALLYCCFDGAIVNEETFRITLCDFQRD